MIVRIFIDTNILVYAHVAGDSRKHNIAIDLLRENLLGSGLWVSTQILNEFYSAMSKNKFEHEKIAEYMAAIMRSVNVLSVTPETVDGALKIKGKYQLSYWDSLMLAAALSSKCSVVYTEDLQNKQVIERSLTIINPF